MNNLEYQTLCQEQADEKAEGYGVGLKERGPYDAETLYKPGDLVTEAEAVYECLKEVEGEAPSETGSANWFLRGKEGE
jgi:hypothetical protein